MKAEIPRDLMKYQNLCDSNSGVGKRKSETKPQWAKFKSSSKKNYFKAESK